jgi:hypothetical protein
MEAAITTTTTTDTTDTTTATETPAETPEKPGTWESIELSADRLEDTIERIVHEGTVRRIVVKHDGAVIAEFPLALGVVGTVLAAPVAGIAAIVALLSDCTIEVERVEAVTADKPDEPAVEPVVEPEPAVATI